MFGFLLIFALAGPANTLIIPKTTVRLEQMGALKQGDAAPWFAGWTLDDQVLNRTRLLRSPHKRHALVFFATWCKPCVFGLKMLRDQKATWQAAGVNVVLVNFRESPDTIRPFLAQHGLSTLPVLLDKFGQMAQAFGVSDGRSARLPRTIVLDQSSTIIGLLGAEGHDYVKVLSAIR